MGIKIIGFRQIVSNIVTGINGSFNKYFWLHKKTVYFDNMDPIIYIFCSLSLLLQTWETQTEITSNLPTYHIDVFWWWLFSRYVFLLRGIDTIWRHFKTNMSFLKELKRTSTKLKSYTLLVYIYSMKEHLFNVSCSCLNKHFHYYQVKFFLNIDRLFYTLNIDVLI